MREFKKMNTRFLFFLCLTFCININGVFKRTDSPLIAHLCNSAMWINNAILTVEGEDGSGGIYLCVGPGAGALPVATAMIRDAEGLL